EARGHADTLDLAGRAERDVVEHEDASWNLERRKSSRGERAEFGLARWGAVVIAQHDGRAHLLAQRGVRDRERGSFRDREVGEQRLFDLARRNLLAAAVDDLLEPAGDREVAVVVEHTLVAGAEPAVAERGRVRVAVGASVP